MRGESKVAMRDEDEVRLNSEIVRINIVLFIGRTHGRAKLSTKGGNSRQEQSQ